MEHLGEQVQQAVEIRLIARLQAVDQDEGAAGLERAGDFGGYRAADFRREFVKEIDRCHEVKRAVGEREPLGGGVDGA